jgi:hypothetical protein
VVNEWLDKIVELVLQSNSKQFLFLGEGIMPIDHGS